MTQMSSASASASASDSTTTTAATLAHDVAAQHSQNPDPGTFFKKQCEILRFENRVVRSHCREMMIKHLGAMNALKTQHQRDTKADKEKINTLNSLHANMRELHKNELNNNLRLNTKIRTLKDTLTSLQQKFHTHKLESDEQQKQLNKQLNKFVLMFDVGEELTVSDVAAAEPPVSPVKPPTKRKRVDNTPSKPKTNTRAVRNRGSRKK